jgi:putative DNA methylase
VSASDRSRGAVVNRKLIEVALPLEAINEQSAREKNPFLRGHPRALHMWWARRPLASCRAVLFASLVDDPSARPDLYPTEEAQDEARAGLLALIERLVTWDALADPDLRDAVAAALERSGIDPREVTVADPFCGGGSIPIEAQRLGVRAYAADLNPVPVLITRALADLPARFELGAPVSGAGEALAADAARAAPMALAADIRHYGDVVSGRAREAVAGLYPAEPDGRSPSAWIWARTVTCPNPACRADAPLVRSFALSTKRGRRARVVPAVDRAARDVSFAVALDDEPADAGTVARRGARCLVCQTTIPFEHIRAESRAGRLGRRLMASVIDAPRSRTFASGTPVQEQAADVPADGAAWRPTGDIVDNPGHTNVYRYGMTTWGDLYTDRQVRALDLLCTEIVRIADDLERDARSAGVGDDDRGLEDGGTGARAYAEAIVTYLALALSRFTDFSNALCSWDAGNTNFRQLFARQALPMAWDYAETRVVDGVVSFGSAVEWTAGAVAGVRPAAPAEVQQRDAASGPLPHNAVVCTDPPYYDNIGYADLADFFYVWLRRILGRVSPDLFSTLLTPKSEELVASAFRFEGGRDEARRHFEAGLHAAFRRIRDAQHPDFPFTLFYAFKQTETDSADGSTASTGWETMLQGLIDAGFSITGTWPVRTEQRQRAVAAGSNALASSIVLACRPRSVGAPPATRREFVNALRAELPPAIRSLQHSNIAPVDLAQASIGPGMAVYTRFARVVEADGRTMTVRQALGLINQALDELLAAQEGDFDADTRWAIAWFAQYGFNDGPYGDAETLSTAKNTSVGGLVASRVVASRAGRVRLLDRGELPGDWAATTDGRLTVWELVQHLIRGLADLGEDRAADLLRTVGGLAEPARELAYRLYSVCERKRWTEEALALNALIVAWPHLAELASAGHRTVDAHATFEAQPWRA